MDAPINSETVLAVPVPPHRCITNGFSPINSISGEANAAAITSRMGKNKLPTHIEIYAERAGLPRDSVILLEQIRTLDKRRLRERIGHLDDGAMAQVNGAISVSFGLEARTAYGTLSAVPGAVAATEDTEVF